MSGYLSNDPAGQKPTGHQQSASAKSYQRSTTRVGERPTRSSRGGASATTAATSRATTATTLSGSGTVNGDVDRAVLQGRSGAEARQNLLLVNPEALGSASDRTGALTGLILRVHSSLDLVTGVLQNRNIPTGRRLGESGGGRS